MARILIIDDDIEVCNMLTMAIGRMGHEVDYALTIKSGLDENLNNDFDVVFLDVNLPDGNGLEAIPLIKESPSSPEVIIITGNGDPDGAELAIKTGVWDYLQKSPSLKGLDLQLSRALQYREKKIAGQQQHLLDREDIIGSSPLINHCMELVSRAANTDVNVLITGETGTGKELFANAIHRNSSRRHNDFVVVDCASLPETLVESILFGHEKGAYTGADRSRRGLISQADGGTLFLDEVGELPLSTQKAFLRVLQERRFRPVGAKTESTSQFRLVAATNRNLDRMVEKGLFRQDLLYRLRSISIELPPLRKRVDDVIKLAVHYLTLYCTRNHCGTKGFSPEFMEGLRAYPWPGNVRELVNCLENALSMAGDEPTLIPIHLPTQIRVQLTRNSVSSHAGPHTNIAANAPATGLGRFKDYKEAVVVAAEKHYLNGLMKAACDDIKSACQMANLSRARLYALLKKHHLSGKKENLPHLPR
ncbi:MAG: sigma-54-dependent Fis family transcriptional regulator [Desulfobacterales bacterium]|nr:sigma-54-dependent Fis family transcriptional regulator [Desulfobacterales bacterium]